jgi:hypothetical protein
MRDLLAGTLSPERKRTLHHSFAKTLEACDSVAVEAIAVHYYEAGQVRKAAEYALPAARKASKALAFESAVRFFRMALHDSTGNGVRFEIADALANAGHGPEAARMCLELTSSVPEGDRIELSRRAAAQFLNSGHVAEGMQTMDTVLRAVGLRMPASKPEAVAWLMLGRAWLWLRGLRFQHRDPTASDRAAFVRIDVCWSVVQGLGMVDTIRAAAFQTLHLILALRAGELSRLTRAFAVDAAWHATFGTRRSKHTASALERAAALSSRANEPYGSALIELVSGMAAFLSGKWTEARDRLSGAETSLRTRCTGVAWELATARLMGCVASFFRGDIAELLTRIPTLLAQAGVRGDLYEATDLRIRIAHVCRLAEDEPSEAQHELQEALASWPRAGFCLQHWWAFIADVEIALYQAEPLTAWGVVNRTWPPLRRSLFMSLQYVRIESLHHRAISALALAASQRHGRPEQRRLLRLASRDCDRIASEDTRWGNALVLLVRAGVAACRGATPDVLQSMLTGCEERLSAADMYLYAAAARYRRGEVTGNNAVRDSAAREMSDRSIRNVARLVEMLAPWP